MQILSQAERGDSGARLIPVVVANARLLQERDGKAVGMEGPTMQDNGVVQVTLNRNSSVYPQTKADADRCHRSLLVEAADRAR
jgi:hypothetical protein